MQKKCMHQLKKKRDFVKLSSDSDKEVLFSLLVNTTFFYFLLWFKNYIGINYIMFNYSYRDILVTGIGYEELKNKMQLIWAQFLLWKTP